MAIAVKSASENVPNLTAATRYDDIHDTVRFNLTRLATLERTHRVTNQGFELFGVPLDAKDDGLLLHTVGG